MLSAGQGIRKDEGAILMTKSSTTDITEDELEQLIYDCSISEL